MIQRLSRFFRSLALLILNRGGYSKSVRSRLLGEYVWFWFLSWLPIKIETVSLAGYKWRIFDLVTFVGLFEEIMVEHQYKPRRNKKIKKILDLGGNIGMSVLYFKLLYPKAEITCFEPDKKTFDTLKQNVMVNKLEKVNLINKAVGNKAGLINFFVQEGGGSPLMSIYKKRGGKKMERVKMVRLAKWLKGKKFDLIKMDIEGAEYDLIRDLARLGKLKGDFDLMIEAHLHIEEKRSRLGELIKHLEENGFNYQISALLRPPFETKTVEDVMIWAYKV